MTAAPRRRNQAASGTHAFRVGSMMTVSSTAAGREGVRGLREELQQPLHLDAGQRRAMGLGTLGRALGVHA